MTAKGDKTSATKLSATIKACRNILRKDKGLSSDIERIPQLIWMMFLKFLDDLERIEEDAAILSGTNHDPLIPFPYRWRDWAEKKDGMTGEELIKFVDLEKAIGPDGEERAGLLHELRNLPLRSNQDRRHVVSLVASGVTNKMLNGYLMRDILNRIETINFSSTDELHLLSRFYENMLKEMRDAAETSGEFYTPRPVVELMVSLVNPILGETILDPASGTGGFLVEAFRHLQPQVNNTADRDILQHNSIFGGEAKPLPFLLCQMNLLLNGLHRPQISYGNSLTRKLTEIGDSDRVDVILANPPFGGEEEDSITQFFPRNFKTTETALLFLLQIVRLLKRKQSNGERGRAAIIAPDGVLASTGVGAKIIHHIVSNYNLHSIIQLPEGIFEPYTQIPGNILFIETGSATSSIRYFEHSPPSNIAKYTKTRPVKIEHFEPIIEKWNNFDGEGNCWEKDVSDMLTFDNKGECVSVRLDNINPNYMNPKPKMETRQIISNSKEMLDDLMSTIPNFSGIDILQNNTWNWRKISSFCKQVDRKEVLLGYKEYPLLGVSLEGRGPFIRETKVGSEISSKSHQRVEEGDFIYSRLFAWKGSFGMITQETDGCYCSNEFPIFRCDDTVLEEFLLLYFLQPSTWRIVESYCTGTTKASRNRFKEQYFLDMEVPIPSLEIQEKLVSHHKLVKQIIEKSRLLKDTIDILSDAEIYNMFNEASNQKSTES